METKITGINLIDYECWAITFPSRSHLDWYAHKVLGFGKDIVGNCVPLILDVESNYLTEVGNCIIVLGEIDAERIENIYGERNLLGDGENLEESGFYMEGEFKQYG